MRAAVRTVARGSVLVTVGGLCAATAVGGAFDVAPAGTGLVGVAVTEQPAPSAPGAAAGPESGTARDDEACAAAQESWNAAARAQVDLSVEHPRDLVTGFVTARDALAEATPPPDVVADWAVVRSSLTVIADAVEATGPEDRADLVRAIDRAGRHVDTGALAAASERVTAYLQAGCGAAAPPG
ncbi:hypothetical protein [Cellulosimicrobium arenosum]|uniref:DUF4439 domain-containing protein n=1 Tax=Cellulosimicrobium arenosum TaxID=2708133 RepID=A0A927G8H8_9MICO|nr:hypothetical protein [Cellulosimicrobium arenosum]MBD8078896.1 hypothetical protein [Cellulosimicrobium arenosum]